MSVLNEIAWSIISIAGAFVIFNGMTAKTFTELSHAAW
jgi:hypothetical protein